MMNKNLIAFTVLIIIFAIFADYNAVAQIRIDEVKLSPGHQQEQQMRELKQKTLSQEELIQKLQQQIETAQQQIQALIVETEILAGIMQSEKVNNATNISILNGAVAQVEEDIKLEINNRLNPISQALQISGSQVTLQAQGGLTIKSGGVTSIESPNTIKMTTAIIEGNANFAKFAKIIQGETIMVNSVVSANYTPGAGNIW